MLTPRLGVSVGLGVKMSQDNHEEFDRALIEELAGMAARRIAIARYRAAGMSWSQSRKASLDTIADKQIKVLICNALREGLDQKEAIRSVVDKEIKKYSF
jgi:hypothetical protein